MTSDNSLLPQLEQLGRLSLPGKRHKYTIPAGFEDLPPLLKALLVADGTVTVQVEAAFGEDIRVSNVLQEPIASPCAIPVINASVGTEIFYRHVDLIGSNTGEKYVSAWSILNGTVMDRGLFHRLIDKEVGMGEVLRNAARGSFREVLDMQRDHSTDTVSRTYAVFLEATPCILITETFLISRFRV